MYAAGPFTRVVFAITRDGIQLLVPRKHSAGERGDLVTTLIQNTHRPDVWQTR